MKIVLGMICLVWAGGVWAAEAVSLLWDPGPRHRCFQHVQANDGTADFATRLFQNNDCPPLPRRYAACSAFRKDGMCPYWNLITYGWDLSERGKYPAGWGAWAISGGWGRPLELALVNNARTAPDACKLREVTFGWDWPDLAFKRSYEGEGLMFGALKTLEVGFTARVLNVLPALCESAPSTFVSIDVVLGFPNDVGYSIGVLVFNQNGLDMNGNPQDDIFYSDYDPALPERCIQAKKCQTLLHGNRLMTPARMLKSGYQRNLLEFAALFKSGKYLPPPPAPYTWDDALVAHIQVVNHTRGGNLRVDLKDQQVNAVPGPEFHSVKCEGAGCFLSKTN